MLQHCKVDIGAHVDGVACVVHSQNGCNPPSPHHNTDLYKQGYLHAEFPVWKQGRAEWQPFSQVPEASGSAPPSQPPANGVHGAVVHQAPTQIDEMARFQAEIGQLEEAPGSPEEKRFQEDDGTWYTWDSTLRKYIPEGISSGIGDGMDNASLPIVPQYDPADMVFEDDAAPMPSLPVVNAGQQDDGDAVADALEDERRGVCALLFVVVGGGTVYHDVW